MITLATLIHGKIKEVSQKCLKCIPNVLIMGKAETCLSKHLLK